MCRPACGQWIWPVDLTPITALHWALEFCECFAFQHIEKNYLAIMCIWVTGTLDIFSSLWLIADMIFDALTTKCFYEAASLVSEEDYPFHHRFMYNNSGYHYPESAFFFASAGSMVLPIPIAIIFITHIANIYN